MNITPSWIDMCHKCWFSIDTLGRGYIGIEGMMWYGYLECLCGGVAIDKKCVGEVVGNFCEEFGGRGRVSHELT